MRTRFRTLLLAGAASLAVSGAIAATTINGVPATISQLVQIVWNDQNISAANPMPVNLAGSNTVTANQGTPAAQSQANAWPVLAYQGTPPWTVQGAGTAGVPVNAFAGQYNATLPTLATGTAAYAALDVNGRQILAPTSSVLADLRVGGNLVTNANPVPGSIPNVQAALGANPGQALTMQGDVATGRPLPAAIVPSTVAQAGLAPVVARAATVLTGKASAGNLYGYSLTQGGTAGFFAFLDLAAAPTAGAAITPVECVPVAASSFLRVRQDVPDRYATGVQVVSTTSCTTYTANTPVQMSVSVQ